MEGNKMVRFKVNIGGEFFEVYGYIGDVDPDQEKYSLKLTYDDENDVNVISGFADDDEESTEIHIVTELDAIIARKAFQVKDPCPVSRFTFLDNNGMPTIISKRKRSFTIGSGSISATVRFDGTKTVASIGGDFYLIKVLEPLMQLHYANDNKPIDFIYISQDSLGSTMELNIGWKEDFCETGVIGIIVPDNKTKQIFQNQIAETGSPDPKCEITSFDTHYSYDN